MRGASANTIVAHGDLKLVLTKGQRAETALARYQIFIKTDVDRKVQTAEVQDPRVETADLPKVQCGWRVQAYLQRNTCFWSMSGLFSCTDLVSDELPDAETGAADLDPAQATDACGLSFAPAREARERLEAKLSAGAEARFEDDYRLKLRPLLTASGVQVRRAP
ncbi:hypothetical protein ASD79_05095 [Caulobacter sp. Root655]|nr:hypothetical protein ASD79_05095 [Caulobacter sp. Root655]